LIGVGRRTRHDLAAESRFGEIVEGGDLFRLHRIAAVHDNPRAFGKAPKRAIGIAQMRRHVLLQRGRGVILQQPCILHAPQIAGVRADEEVGLGGVALGAHALQQLLGVAGERAHFNPRRGLERGVERAVSVVMTGGVEVDVVWLV
jgi:hypothetical protein